VSPEKLQRLNVPPTVLAAATGLHPHPHTMHHENVHMPPQQVDKLFLPLCLPHCVSHRLPHRLSYCVSRCVFLTVFSHRLSSCDYQMHAHQMQHVEPNMHMMQMPPQQMHDPQSHPPGYPASSCAAPHVRDLANFVRRAESAGNLQEQLQTVRASAPPLGDAMSSLSDARHPRTLNCDTRPLPLAGVV
jgi:hypothetical protein